MVIEDYKKCLWILNVNPFWFASYNLPTNDYSGKSSSNYTCIGD